MIILVDICKYIILCDIITLLKANRISKLKYSIDLKYCRRLEMKKKYISLFLVILLGMIFNISNIKAYEETNDVIGQTKFVDKDGNNIDEWTSGKEPHMIKNLNVGESYTLIEETAPQGYKIAESIDFKIEDTGAIQHVVMYDEHLPVKVKTGDDNSYQYWIVSGLLSLAALLIIRFKVKREQQ